MLRIKTLTVRWLFVSVGLSGLIYMGAYPTVRELCIGMAISMGYAILTAIGIGLMVLVAKIITDVLFFFFDKKNRTMIWCWITAR